MHAVVPAAPERGLVPGVIFALRNRHDGFISQQNRLHPCYLVYVAQDGNVSVNHTDVKKLSISLVLPAKTAANPFPRCIDQSITPRKTAGAWALLHAPAKGYPIMIALKEERDIDSLFHRRQNHRAA